MREMVRAQEVCWSALRRCIHLHVGNKTERAIAKRTDTNRTNECLTNYFTDLPTGHRGPLRVFLSHIQTNRTTPVGAGHIDAGMIVVNRHFGHFYRFDLAVWCFQVVKCVSAKWQAGYYFLTLYTFPHTCVQYKVYISRIEYFWFHFHWWTI